MKVPVVLAVLAVFAVLRFRRTGLLLWAGAWWVGIYILLRFGFSAPIPSSVRRSTALQAGGIWPAS